MAIASTGEAMRTLAARITNHPSGGLVPTRQNLRVWDQVQRQFSEQPRRLPRRLLVLRPHHWASLGLTWHAPCLKQDGTTGAWSRTPDDPCGGGEPTEPLGGLVPTRQTLPVWSRFRGRISPKKRNLRHICGICVAPRSGRRPACCLPLGLCDRVLDGPHEATRAAVTHARVRVGSSWLRGLGRTARVSPVRLSRTEWNAEGRRR